MDVGLADSTIGEHLLLRSERVPYGGLGGRIDERGDRGGPLLSVALRDEPLDADLATTAATSAETIIAIAMTAAVKSTGRVSAAVSH